MISVPTSHFARTQNYVSYTHIVIMIQSFKFQQNTLFYKLPLLAQDYHSGLSLSGAFWIWLPTVILPSGLNHIFSFLSNSFGVSVWGGGSRRERERGEIYCHLTSFAKINDNLHIFISYAYLINLLQFNLPFSSIEPCGLSSLKYSHHLPSTILLHFCFSPILLYFPFWLL